MAAAGCEGIQAERAQLAADHAAVKSAIADIAMGGKPKRRGVSAGDAGRAAAGTAASLLLPFGIGMLVSAGAYAAEKAAAKAKRAKQAPAPDPDVPALIDRQRAIEARLAVISATPCTVAAPQ